MDSVGGVCVWGGSEGLEGKGEMIYMKYSNQKSSKMKLKEPDYKANLVLHVYSLNFQQSNPELWF